MMRDAIDEVIFKLRIMVGALVGGVATFGGIAFFLVRGGELAVDSSLKIPLMGALGAIIIGLFLAYPVIERGLIKKSGEGPMDPRDFLRAYSTLAVVRGAMIESIGLFGGVIYLLTAHAVGLLAILCSIVLLLFRLPSRQEAEDLAAGVGGLVGQEPTPGSTG